MDELMRRRMALMAAGGDNEMIPGKSINIPNSLANGADVAETFNGLAQKPSEFAVYVTAKPKSNWVNNQLIFVQAGAGGNVVSFVRWRGGSYNTVDYLTADYDAVSQQNTVFYLVEVTT